MCSTLRRSVESAELLCKGQNVLQSDLFSEAQLPYANWQKIKLPPGAWLVLFRISWFLGYCNNSESRKQVQVRAKQAAKKLIQLAENHGNIIYIGHGIFNRFVAGELIKNGWQGARNPAGSYWGHTDYNKVESS